MDYTDEVIAKLVTQFSRSGLEEFVTALATKYPEVFLSIWHKSYKPIDKAFKVVYPEYLPAELPEYPEYWQRVVIAAYDRGEKLSAIKVVRALTGAGLREAKEFCDRLYEKFSNIQPAIDISHTE